MEASRYKNILSRTGLCAAVLFLLSGCKFVLLDPKGSVGVQEKELIITALLLMLIVVIPVILMTIYFSYKYRASNTDEEYKPEWSHSTKIEVVVWTVPLIIIAILGTITWHSTHELEPSVPLKHEGKPMTIEVVSLDWKWLFIYPEQHIATVNYVAFPEDVPVKFKITSDNIMNSFFIPQLGSQIYAMPSMVTRLNLIADHPGEFDGISSNFSGDGFSHMKFKARAFETKQAFAAWVDEVKASPKSLSDFSDYRQLAKPSIDVPVTYYSTVMPDLFNSVVTQFPGGMQHSGGVGMGKSTATGHQHHSMTMDVKESHEHMTEDKG